MGSASHCLEMTILSAENLRLDGKYVKKDTFVVIKFDPYVNIKSTNADHEGGSNPCWNQKLEVDMPMQAPFIYLEVKCRIGSSANRVIGTARVPVSDFLGGYFPENYLHFLSYRLRDSRGEKNGIINVSLKVKSLADYYNATPTVRNNLPGHYTCSSSSSSSSTSPFTQQTWGMPVGQKNYQNHGEGTVTGVPVWCASRA